MIPLLLLVLAASATSVQSDEFDVTVAELYNSKQGLRVGLSIANKVQAGRLFIHLEPNEGDAKTVLFMPPVKLAKDRFTYYFKGGRDSVQATLVFPPDEIATTSVLVVGEAAPPYRQTALALDLTQRIAPEPKETPAPPTPPPSASVSPSERVIATYRPPFRALGETIVLKSGKEGPDGTGWIRIYTDLPEVSLNQLGEGIEHPQQIWAGPDRMLFIVKLNSKRAIAVDVVHSEIQTAHYIDKTMFERMVGPGTPYPKRVYMGK